MGLAAPSPDPCLRPIQRKTVRERDRSEPMDPAKPKLLLFCHFAVSRTSADRFRAAIPPSEGRLKREAWPFALTHSNLRRNASAKSCHFPLGLSLSLFSCSFFFWQRAAPLMPLACCVLNSLSCWRSLPNVLVGLAFCILPCRTEFGQNNRLQTSLSQDRDKQAQQLAPCVYLR